MARALCKNTRRARAAYDRATHTDVRDPKLLVRVLKRRLRRAPPASLTRSPQRPSRVPHAHALTLSDLAEDSMPT